jgi:hypothetical protein
LNRREPVCRPLRQSNGEPVFAEAWHAQAIALVEMLIAEGRIEAGEWSQTLGAEVDRRANDATGDKDTDATYYGAVLSALELVLDRNRLAMHDEVDRREQDWRNAYLATPHGKPVVLPNKTT